MLFQLFLSLIWEIFHDIQAKTHWYVAGCVYGLRWLSLFVSQTSSEAISHMEYESSRNSEQYLSLETGISASLQLLLASMDAIVDKDSGEVSAELIELKLIIQQS